MVFSVFSAGAAPCKDCSDRHVGCHGDCEKYKAYRSDLESKHEHEKQENSYHDYQRDRSTEYALHLWKCDRAFKRHYKGKPIKK